MTYSKNTILLEVFVYLKKKILQNTAIAGALAMHGSCILIAYISVGVFIFPWQSIYDTPPPPPFIF